MIYCFTGMPLAGKSTYSKRLASELGLQRFATGDFARSLGMGDEPSIRERDLSLSLDSKIVAKVASFVGGCLGDCVIDGFPRSAEQYGTLAGWGYGFKVVFMTANPLVIYDRLGKRASAEGRPEDLRDVVVGRVRRSVEWRAELKALAGAAFVEVPEEEGYEVMRWKVCGGR